MKGHNALKPKVGGKPITKEKARELKKAEAAETAAALSEYIADSKWELLLPKHFFVVKTKLKRMFHLYQRR